MMAAATKPELHLAGPTQGSPSFEDMMKLFRKLTGKEPTAEQVREAREAWEKK